MLNTYRVYTFIGLISISATVRFADAAIMAIESQPVQSTWTADGSTQYKVDINVDSTGLDAGTRIRDGQFYFTVPAELQPYLNLVSASKPTSNDFFSGFTMTSSKNYVGQTLISGQEWDNNRRVSTSTGPLPSTGEFGEYIFTLAPGAPKGTYSFGMHSIYFDDTAGNPYGSADGLNSDSCTINNQSFDVVPEPTAFALLTLGGIGVLARRRKAQSN